MARSSVRLAVKVPRNRQTVADQLVLGLITGGFIGSGILLESRDADRIRFKRALSSWQGIPDSGEILITQEQRGVSVECALDCGGLWLRHLLLGLIIGVAVGVLVFLEWGIVAAMLGGLPAAGVVHTLTWTAERARMRRRMESYIHNTTYLKAM